MTREGRGEESREEREEREEEEEWFGFIGCTLVGVFVGISKGRARGCVWVDV